MTDNNFQSFANLLKEESQFYPGTAALTPTRVRGYFESLQRFELTAIKAAFIRLREKSEFFPTIRALVEQLEGSTSEKAELAWHTFFSLLSESSYVSLWVYDKATAYAIQSLGGWLTISDELREASIEMIANFEKRFKAAYKIATERASSLEPTVHYAGTFEANNRQSLNAICNWADGREAKTINLPLCVVLTDKYRKLEIPFDVRTMQIEGGARKALESDGGALRQYLPTSIKPKALLESTIGESEMVPEADVQELLASLRTGMKRMPKIDECEIEESESKSEMESEAA